MCKSISLHSIVHRSHRYSRKQCAHALFCEFEARVGEKIQLKLFICIERSTTLTSFVFLIYFMRISRRHRTKDFQLFAFTIRPYPSRPSSALEKIDGFITWTYSLPFDRSFSFQFPIIHNFRSVAYDKNGFWFYGAWKLKGQAAAGLPIRTAFFSVFSFSLFFVDGENIIQNYPCVWLFILTSL